jgi:O-succinylbenzoic acid--CoA ligase
VAFWLHLATAKHPDRAALEFGGLRLTYAALSAKAVRREPTLGVRPGDRVALQIADPLEFAISLHACMLAGAQAVPIDLRLSAGERSARAAGAALTLRDESLGGPWMPRAAGGEMLDRVATVMYTSGTTSAPKPVELTYGNWQANAFGSAVALGLDPAERWLCAMPLAHVGGLSILIRSAVYATTVVLHERFEIEAVLAELMNPERRITMVSLVPTMLARLLDAGLERPPMLRWALLGGGPIPATLLARAEQAGVPVAPTYGMTEACSQIATFGVPLHGVDLLTERGEIKVRGPIVAPGELGEDGWLHTGDLGAFDERGRLTIIGRKADTIISGGENVSPAEVESVLLEHPSVADAAVFGRTDAEWGEAVVAAVVLRDGEPLDADALRAHCQQRLARFKVPKAFERVERLPRTESGKLLRRELDNGESTQRLAAQ